MKTRKGKEMSNILNLFKRYKLTFVDEYCPEKIDHIKYRYGEYIKLKDIPTLIDDIREYSEKNHFRFWGVIIDENNKEAKIYNDYVE